MQRALVIIFLLGGAVKLADIGYTHLLRPYLLNQPARKPPPPKPYSDADRARDHARAERLQREARNNPALAHLTHERREERRRLQQQGARFVN